MDIEKELSKALADPEIMNKVSGILSSLGQGEADKAENAAPSDTDMLKNSLAALGNMQDDRTRLIMAIKPFLSEKRAPYMDSAVMILRLIKMGKITEIFK